MLALSKVAEYSLNSIYPEVGEKKYQLIFSNIVKPCNHYLPQISEWVPPVNVLFSRLGNSSIGKVIYTESFCT